MSDPAIVAQLIVKHRHDIVAFLYGMVPDPHAVEDLFQEICLVTVRKAAEFQDGTNFLGWARVIARHKLREHLRNRIGIQPDDRFFETIEQAFDETSSGLQADPRRDALRHCLDLLQPESRRILSLRYDEGLNVGAIADRIGRSRTAVHSLLQRIREVLKECVARRSLGATP